MPFNFKKKFNNPEISPDEIFLDASNIPNFDRHQFEGRMEKPISPKVFLFFASVITLISFILIVRVFTLQIVKGEEFASRAENNRLRSVSLPAERGLVYDKNGELLVWNGPESRSFNGLAGLAHVLGYTGRYFDEIVGKTGIEKSFDNILKGVAGLKIVELDSKNEIQSEYIQKNNESGQSIYLSIDSRVQNRFYEILSEVVEDRGFNGGTGVIMNVKTGEILALTNYPEYNPSVLNEGQPVELIESYRQDPKTPFLNRAVSGLYAPGSIIKPFIAMAALNEKIIDPKKEIFSSGSISIPNPYNPDKESVFYDWKAHGLVNMIDALAVSSNVYFYTVGGGYGDINGLGINKIKSYLELFGFGSKTGITLDSEADGLVPNMEFKKNDKNDSVWRVGDTYNVSIGQGGLLVTPLQMVVAVASLANDGLLMKPSIVKINYPDFKEIGVGLEEDYFKIVREGMHQAAIRGTASALSSLPIRMAAKTGTAEIGSGKIVNSWLVGFWPYDNPRFAITVVLEKGSSSNLVGAVYATRQLMEWILIHTPEYLTN